jgi:hypothetical protein
MDWRKKCIGYTEHNFKIRHKEHITAMWEKPLYEVGPVLTGNWLHAR